MPATISPDVSREIDALHEAGASNTAIADKLGLGRNTVGRYLKKSAIAPARGPLVLSTELTADDIRQFRGMLVVAHRQSVCEACSRVIFLWNNETRGRCNWCGAKWHVLATHRPPLKNGKVRTSRGYERLGPDRVADVLERYPWLLP